MDATRWQRLETLFMAALECPAESRTSMLRDATQDDPTLYSEIQAMLAAHSGAGRLAVESQLLHDDGDSSASDAAVDSYVGPYRLIQQIGRGGMGVVYRAERADGQYTQTVAVKLVRSGLVTPELVSRFRSERQILARLEHPGIARLLDGGITDAGVPYLVMEHVDGRAITEHCDAAGLTIEERLGLFLIVCGAVNHAHRNLVVHRDLKPSNILVAADGSVKLLDFGIARLVTPSTERPEAMTSTMLPVMTPEYASPEQVLGAPITTATDVYGLGLLLYELLSGERAQRSSGTSLLVMQRRICEEEPPLPSSALVAGTAEETDRRVRVRSATRAERLRRRLRGDLDTIVDTALRKDPARRYASVEQLAADINRHLSGLPVLARPDTAGYRAAKFMRRHRLGVTATAAVILSLLAGLTIALSGLARARSAERIAVEEAATATSVSEFLTDLFRASDPAAARGDTVTARELLDRGAVRVRERLHNQPAVHASLLRTMAQAYESLGLFDAAIPLIEEELEIRTTQAGEESVEFGIALGNLSDLYGRKGDYPRSRELATRAVSIQERTADAYSPELMNALNALGTANGRLGNLHEARTALERSLAIGERVLGPDDIGIAGTLNNLAIIHWQEGDPAGAGSLFERAIGIIEREFGPVHPSLAHMVNNLALAHSQAGDADKAIAAHQRALAIRERILAPDHPDIAESLNNLGVVLLAQKDYAAARDVLERSLAIRESALGADHDFVGATLSNLGFVYLELGEVDTAQSLLERAAAIMERSMGRDHMSMSYPMLGLARIHHIRGHYDEAEAGFRSVIALREARVGEHHPDVTAALRTFAAFLRDRGRIPEADSVAARADRTASTK